MARTERPWIVTPHTPLNKLDDNLWTVESAVPNMKMQRRMSIVRLPDGGLVFYHAIPLAPDALAEVLAWGTPRALVVGHQGHGVDAAAFAEKLGVGLYGPARNEARLRARWPQLTGTLPSLRLGDTCSFEELDGTGWGEPVQVVRSAGGTSLVWCDVFMANDAAETALGSRLLGFAGGPRIPPLVRWFMVKDKAALKAHLERLASLPNLARLIPCHGRMVSEDAAGTLRRAAVVLG